jgi:hypothetical protein
VLSCKFALGNVISCYSSVGLEVVFIVIFLFFVALFGRLPTVIYCRAEWLRYLGKRHLGRQHLLFMLSRKPKKMEVCFSCYSDLPHFTQVFCCASLGGHTLELLMIFHLYLSTYRL